MTEQTNEPTPAIDLSASVAADTAPVPTEVVAPVDPSATVPEDAGTPVSATEPVVVPVATPDSAQAITPGEAASVGVGIDPQETARLMLDEPGHDGAFIHGNDVIGTSGTDVFAADVEGILAAAEQAGRKVKVVEEIKVEIDA